MAAEKVKIKSGMGGSAAGRERTAKTGEYKAVSKKKRRKAARAEMKRGLAES